MHFEECQLHSKVLGRSMNFNVYGMRESRS